MKLYLLYEKEPLDTTPTMEWNKGVLNEKSLEVDSVRVWGRVAFLLNGIME